MNFAERDGESDQFQIAPLIDIVFILLVFFVVTYAVMQEEKVLNLTLPEANAAEAEKRTQREVVVNLGNGGGIVVNRVQMTPAELEGRLGKLKAFAADPGVIIRADGDCPHKFVVQVMNICSRLEIRRVFFSTVSKTERD